MTAKALDVLRLGLLGPLFALGLMSCAPDAKIAVADYPATLVGEWQGTVGGTIETIKFFADRTFVAQMRPTGFISNTLGQGVTGNIRGTWTIDAKVVTLKVDSAEHERVINSTTTSTIESFTQGELVVKSDTGTVTTFARVF